jgi:hypothetical protein
MREIADYIPAVLILFVAAAFIVNGLRGLKGHDVWWPPRTDLGPTDPMVDTGRRARRTGAVFTLLGILLIALAVRLLIRVL